MPAAARIRWRRDGRVPGVDDGTFSAAAFFEYCCALNRGVRGIRVVQSRGRRSNPDAVARSTIAAVDSDQNILWTRACSGLNIVRPAMLQTNRSISLSPGNILSEISAGERV